MLALVVGDAHIPERASSIDPAIQSILQRGNFNQIISVGNVSDATALQMLQNLTPDIPIISVLGDHDEPNAKSQTMATFTAGKYRVGVISGFLVTPAQDIDVLAGFARKLNVDILLSGGSSVFEIQKWAGHYFINPGSLTGTIAEIEEVDLPAAGFCVLDINDSQCSLFIYRLEDSGVKVERAELPLINLAVTSSA